VDRREDARRSNPSGSAKAGFKEAMTSSNVKPVQRWQQAYLRSAAATGAASASRATTSSRSIARQSIHPIARRGLRDRHAYFKRNSGGRVIFGWNCALQDVTSQASHMSALRLIASGK
jgi:hypothetical protein